MEHLIDPITGITVDPFAWRSHELWYALANYVDLFDWPRYRHVARIMIANILAIMRADLIGAHEEARIQRALFDYRQRLLIKYVPAAWRPESFCV